LFILASGFAEAQLVVGNFSSAASGQSQSNRTASFSHNHGAGTDRLLVVWTTIRNDKSVTWVKFDGQEMTEVSDNYDNGKTKIGIWVLENPTSTGNKSITIKYSPHASTGAWFAQSFTGAKAGGEYYNYHRSPNNNKVHTETLTGLTVGSRLMLVGSSQAGSNNQNYTIDGSNYSPTYESGGSNKSGCAVSNAITSTSISVTTRSGNNNGNGYVALHAYEVLEATSYTIPTISTTNAISSLTSCFNQWRYYNCGRWCEYYGERACLE
jgi:hypothetical protein